MKNYRYVLLAAAFYLLSPGVPGADVEAGRSRAATCTACHGYGGISANDEWPNLAGQKQAYMVKQLKDYRDGTREDPVMSPMAQELTDGDIENIAAWFSSLKPH